jgi:hypothetical protein
VEIDTSDYREKVLKCPFCGEIIGMPEEIKTPFGDTLEGGRCGCGALYVFDRTGRKLGEAYSEALALAFDWDYDTAFSTPVEEYKVGKFMGGEGDYRDRSSKFYFIKRKVV